VQRGINDASKTKQTTPSATPHLTNTLTPSAWTIGIEHLLLGVGVPFNRACCQHE